jgi:hypothetical protein
MCYSAEASRNIFLINLVSCIILFFYKSTSNTNKILALFFAYVGLAQLFDWIFWTHQNVQDKNEANINYITTKIAIAINNLIPVVFALIIYMYKHKIGIYSYYILITYIILATIHTIDAYNKVTYTLIKEHSLYWEWNYISLFAYIVYTLYFITLLTLAYENTEYPINIIIVFICITSYILTGYYWKFTAWGRFWCKFSAFIPLIFIILASCKIIKL